ncbi:MAG: hypothetical protein PHW14_05970 [Candidatus Omnitrophica bacterium]|nr:hypothetical protein [Candidatus Omnitrophota bacterium]
MRIRVIRAAIFVLIAVVFMVLAAAPGTRVLAPVLLESLIPSSKVSLGDVVFSFKPSVSFSDVLVEIPGIFSFKAKSVAVMPDLSGNRSPKFKVYLDKTALDILSFSGFLEEGQKMAKGDPRAGSEGMISVFHLKGMRVRSLDPGVQGEADISLSIDVIRQTVLEGALRMNRIKKGSFEASGISMDVTSPGTAEFAVESLVSGKFRISDVEGVLRQKGITGIEIGSFSGKMFGGALSGYGAAGRAAGGYTMDLVADGVDMAKATMELGLGDKIDLAGIMNGDISLKGRFSGPELLTGSLSLASKAGTLLVKDKRFFEMVAEKTRQPLEIVKASFEDYEYTTGTVNLDLDGKDLIMTVYLEGDKGKRDIKVILHDAIDIKGGKK